MADLKPAYLIQGSDEVMLDNWRERLRARVRSEGLSTTLEVLRGERATPATVAEAIATLTLSVGRRYVLADGIESWKDADVAPVAEALAALHEDTVVVLIAIDRPRKGRPRRKQAPVAPPTLAKAVEGCGGEVRSYEAPSAKALPRWIIQQGDDLGLVVDGEAAGRLADSIGLDRDLRPPRVRQHRIVRELEKLATYAPQGGKVDAETVEAITVPDVDAQAFELAEALLEGDRDEALRLDEDLRARGEDLMPILFALLRQLRNARQAWAMVESGRPVSEIAAALRVPPFAAKRIVAQAERAGGERLERLFEELARLDWTLRGGDREERPAHDRDPRTALTLMLARA